MSNFLQFQVPTAHADKALQTLRSFDEQVHACYYTPKIKSTDSEIPNNMMSTMYIDTDFNCCDIDELMFNVEITIATQEIADGDTLS